MEVNNWQEEFQKEATCRNWLAPIKVDLTIQQAARVLGRAGANAPAPGWTEEEVVRLHWRLLERIKLLRDPLTPLEEKFEILRWMFTGPDRDRQPFSFVSCVRVVGLSPLSPAPSYIGAADAEEIRDWVRCRLKRWFRESLAAYPRWVRDAIGEQPGWIAQQLERNPQWLNQQIRRNRVEGDLFA